MATVSDINSLSISRYEQINQISAKEKPDANQQAKVAEAKKKQQQSQGEYRVSISREADAKNRYENKQVADKKERQEENKDKNAENDSKGPRALIQQHDEISKAGNAIREAVAAYNATKKQGQA